jgi:hypothetical protein
MIEIINKTAVCVDKFIIEHYSLDCVIRVRNRVYVKKISLLAGFNVM